MQTVKKILLISISLILILAFISSLYAITGSIGNARAIIRAKTGDVLERTVLVKNINNIPVDIEIFASGELEKYTKIIDKRFRLEAGEEKNAQFTIKVAKEGTTETQVNVRFLSSGDTNSTTQKSGIGLSSTIIIIAEKGDGIFDFDEEEDENNPASSAINKITGNVTGENLIDIKIIAVLITLILIVALVLLLIFSKKNSNRGLAKTEEETKPKKSSKQ